MLCVVLNPPRPVCRRRRHRRRISFDLPSSTERGGQRSTDGRRRHNMKMGFFFFFFLSQTLSLSLFFLSISSSFLPGRRIKTIFEEIFLLKRFARGVRTSLIKWSASQRRGTFSTLYHWNHWRYQTRDVSVFRAHPPLRYYIATDDVNLLMPQSATTTTTREKEKRGAWTSITETLMRRRQRPEAIRDEREYPIEVITIAVETAKTAKMAESMSGQQQQRLGQQKLRKGAAAMKPNNIKSWYRLALGKRIVRWTSSSLLLFFFKLQPARKREKEKNNLKVRN